MARSSSRRTEAIDAVGTLLTQVSSALFITGQALSAESGLTHYRGIAGLARRTADDARRFEAALSVEGLAHRPKLLWQVLLDMDQRVRTAEPNAGHRALVTLERALPRLTIMTVNIDRLHQRAGARDVIEMHGALHDLRCSRCELATRHDSYAGLTPPPRCATCGEVLRPDMPLFGEALPPDPFTRLQAELEVGFELVCAVGLNTMFPYLARPLLLAKQDGIPTVEISQNRTDLTEVIDFSLPGSPARTLASVVDVFTQLRAAH